MKQSLLIRRLINEGKEPTVIVRFITKSKRETTTATAELSLTEYAKAMFAGEEVQCTVVTKQEKQEVVKEKVDKFTKRKDISDTATERKMKKLYRATDDKKAKKFIKKGKKK